MKNKSWLFFFPVMCFLFFIIMVLLFNFGPSNFWGDNFTRDCWWGNRMPFFGIFFGFFFMMFLICMFFGWRGGRCSSWWSNNDDKDYNHHEGDAKSVLKYRLAKGELTEEEYDRLMKKVQS